MKERLESKFQDSVRERLDLWRAVENQYRVLLASLANEIILSLIETGEARRRELAAGRENLYHGIGVWFGFVNPRNVKNRNLGAKLYEEEEQSREKLLAVYHERGGSIQVMNSTDLIKLLESLQSDHLLKRVLENRLEKKRVFKGHRYLVDPPTETPEKSG